MIEQRVRDLLIHHGIQDGGPQLVADILALVAPAELDALATSRSAPDEEGLDVERLSRAIVETEYAVEQATSVDEEAEIIAAAYRALASQDKADDDDAAAEAEFLKPIR